MGICTTCGDLAHGALGVLKYTVGADRTDPATAMRRREACEACPEATDKTILAFCKKCDCWLMAKRGIASETCPLDKWK